MIIDVVDLNLKTLNYHKPYDTARMMRAKTIYRNEDVEITKVEKVDEENFEVSAKVEGSYTERYKVELSIRKEYVEEYSCTCEDFRKGYICKHILATTMETINPHEPSTEEGRDRLLEKRRKEAEERERLYLLRKEEERKKQEYQRKYASALSTIRSFKRENDLSYSGANVSNQIDLKSLYEETKWEMLEKNKYQPELSTQIKLEPKIEIDRSQKLDVNFKIGKTQMYILKDIEEFYEAFLNETILQYGKKLRFVCKEESFANDSKEVLKFILNYAKMLEYNEKIYEGYYYSLMHSSSKTMKLFDDKVDEFFELLKDKPIIFSNYQTGEQVYKFTDETIKLVLDIKKCDESDDYELAINIQNYDYITTNKSIYVFYENQIFKFDKKQNKKLENVLSMFKYDETILIPKDKIEDFKTYVFPEIGQYMQNENLPAEVAKEGLIVNKLASKIYLDLDEKDNIILELKFCYSNYEFNILDSSYKQYVKENNIVRNIPEEREILKRLFSDGFELSNSKKYFVLKDQDLTYEFLSKKVTSYMNDFEVLVTDKFKNKKVRNTRISNISVKLDNGLLELDISKIDIDIDEIKNVLKNYNVKKKYYKLKNGDFLNLEENEDLEFLNNIQNSFDVNYDKLNNGIIKLPVNRTVYLEKLLNQSKTINTTKNNEFTKLVNNIENRNFSEDFQIDENFENVLRDYQKTGYKWLKVLEHYKFGGILADDMGLGKTLQIIAVLASELKNKKTKPSIVVCPSSLVLNWKAEVEKWCKDIKVLIVKGDSQTRKELIDSYEDYNLMITSYDLLKRDVLEYENKQFKYIIADEAQYIKNFATQNATALKSLEGEIKFALTGTPIENSISELWSIFDFIMPGYLYSYNKFKKLFEIPILKENDEQTVKKLKFMINPFILRRIKSDVLTELPEKNITIMKNEMTEEQEKLYISYFAQTKKEVAEELNENGFEKSKFKILMLLTRLRQICCHPSLFIDNYTGESGKLNQCMDIISEAIGSGHKILLFSGYTSMFEIIEEKLKKENINYYKLTGSTSVDKRVEMVEQFNKDESIKIFLISLKAGGTGLNLTGADVVIHYDPWWNISIENQATDRAYRIGQKNSVQVYKLITTNSIEEKINKLQEKKAKLSEQLLSTEETFINKLSKEEIMELFEE